MDSQIIDQLQINFSRQSLNFINLAIGMMMLGVAMDIRVEDFRRIFRTPKAPAIGLGVQFILLPVFTFGLTMVLPGSWLTPSMALGMILLASCPGGNLSNIMTHLAKGNNAVSVSMTAVSSAAAVIMTPLNLAVWGHLNPVTAPILRRVSLDPLDVLVTIFGILGAPLAAGLMVRRFLPRAADRLRRPFKIFSLIFFLLLVAGALAANLRQFIVTLGPVILAVFIQNALAFTMGYWSGRLWGLPEYDSRAISIEVGIQNSALGLVLVFNFFDGLGGMALILAWWSIWHIVTGLTVSYWFSRQPLPAGP